MRVKAFRALRPRPDAAASVACVPYDTVDTAEAAAEAAGNPRSFMRVVRPEINLPSSDPASAEVYAAGAERLRALEREGVLVREEGPSVYLYRQRAGGHSQTGVVACFAVDDYLRGVIRRHELTRPDKQVDRARLMLAARAHTGPVFLTCGDSPAVNAIVAEAAAGAPLFDFVAADGVGHTVWRVSPPGTLVEALDAVPAAYIADGHHRAAAAADVQAECARRRGAGSPRDESDWFLGILYPAGQLRILPYNRCVADLNGLLPAAFTAAVGERFALSAGAGPRPPGPARISMYLQGAWHGLAWEPSAAGDPVAALDVSVLQERLLGPVLGIGDPTRDARIAFVGGSRGPEALAREVDAGRAAVAFSMFPVALEQMMAVADAGRLMPPKSTWFDPKPRSGLLVHTF
ncbi:MAG: DUF1015 domain-containing protein [Lentisphaerae bacterium]|nr:DUF1015 domain-containing protein [Lentisphaerota bacterium]